MIEPAPESGFPGQDAVVTKGLVYWPMSALAFS